ncbi:MAG: ATP-binding protein [Negativicutes bacterium]
MRRIFFLAVFVLIGSGIILGLDRYYCITEYKENLSHLNRFAERVEYVLTRSIPDRLGAVEDLKSFLLATDIQRNNESFDQYAAWVLAHNPTLDWIGYADHTQTIRNIYPLPGNEAILNIDLNTRPDDIPWVQRAILTQRTVLAPPMQSIQGFNSVSAYSPIIKDNVFHGLAIGQFRLDKVIDHALMDLLRENPNYFVVLTDTTGHVLWRSGSYDADSYIKRILFPVGESEWIAYFGWRKPPQPDPVARHLLWICGATIVLLLLILFNNIMNRNDWLTQTVQEKTAELALHNVRLTEEIDERKKAAKALQNSERRLEKFLSAIPDIIFHADKKGTIIEIRKGSNPEKDFPDSLFLHHSIQETFSPDIATVYLDGINETLRSGNIHTTEHPMQINGRTKYWEARFIAGDLDDVFIVIRDITDQKQAVATMLEAKETWARTEKLASLGTMAAGLSHEINQPLNSIKVIASGILYSHNRGRKRELAEMIKAMEEISQQTDRINSIISHMRAFIRRDDSQIIPSDWNIAVNQALKLVGKQLSDHGISVHKNLSENLPMVFASPTALEEIVINLLVNAMQALDTTQQNNKTITVRTFHSQNAEVILEISDNGPGISLENKEKIFVPFFSTKPGSENHGLGLSIVHTITTAYQGEIHLLPNEFTGATFQVILPACIHFPA